MPWLTAITATPNAPVARPDTSTSPPACCSATGSRLYTPISRNPSTATRAQTASAQRLRPSCPICRPSFTSSAPAGSGSRARRNTIAAVMTAKHPNTHRHEIQVTAAEDATAPSDRPRAVAVARFDIADGRRLSGTASPT